MVDDLIRIQNKDDDLDQILKPLIDETAPNLITIPGIGYRLAGLLIGEIGDVTLFPTPDKLVKFAGLDVRVNQSGTSDKHGCLRKRGVKESIRFVL